MKYSTPRLPILCTAALGLLLLGGCTEARLLIHTAKQISPSADPADGGVYKIGNPYQINGVWYYPKVDYEYVETGIASWYGPGFHGKRTANGEIYDQNMVTAAHRTLPMPSMVRVTNLENGRSIRVRINDRGPFARGRIIDLSRHSAQLLGFVNQGTAKVRVEILAPESRQIAYEMGGLTEQSQIARASIDDGVRPPVTPAPRVAVTTGTLAGGQPPPAPARGEVVDSPTQTVARTEPEITTTAVGPANMYIQAGAFTAFDNANRLRARLSVLGPTRVDQAAVGEQTYFRVRVGPIADLNAADTMLERVIQAGHPEARLIVDR